VYKEGVGLFVWAVTLMELHQPMFIDRSCMKINFITPGTIWE
jgi:hypothetical protein